MAASCATYFVCTGCNRLPNCVHWGLNNTIAYGAYESIALYQFQREKSSGAVLSLLKGHRGKVHCVKWLNGGHSTNRKQELISGAADNTVIVWRGSDNEFLIQNCLQGHTGPVTAIDGIYVPSKGGTLPELPRTLVASASVDSSVRIWRRREGSDEFTLKQTITFGNGFALDVAFGLLHGTAVPVLAIGGDDTKVHIYILQGDEFIRVQSLKGHEDWIRGLEFAVDDSGDLLLASCAQDCFIRLWRITKDSNDDDSNDIKLKGNRFAVKQEVSGEHYVVTLESLLAGHEQWIYAIHWQNAYITENGGRHQPMSLLSASMDKTMIIWELDAETGVWVDKVRVGEVGGNTLGLYGCQFSPDGSTILAHGFQGAFHVWSTNTKDNSRWEPAVTVSGHFQSVHDIAWDPEGSFFLSVSTDQTTRLYAPWRRDGQATTWHEIARPQVHGYDMQCLAMIGRFKFVSGADEKVLRVFESPVNFLENFQRISSEVIHSDTLKEARDQLPEGASVPALGLSNKAVFQGDSGLAPSDREIIHPSDQYTDIYFEPVKLTVPPTEEHLLQNTLWPETQKLYGHGFEIFSVAAHPRGTLIASSCKASKAEHATIILWDTASWLQVGELSSHALTVTQLAFSHSGKHLLAVSRDRTWSLFEEGADRSDSSPLYTKVASTDKKSAIHGRIIWGCSWSDDDTYFATASRDKKVIIWGRTQACQSEASPLGDYGACSAPLDVGASATAVDFAPVQCDDGRYILAIGLESGDILVYTWKPDAPQDWTKCPLKLLGHTATVKRLKWRPLGKRGDCEEGKSDRSLDLLSCSADCSVFLQTITLGDI